MTNQLFAIIILSFFFSTCSSGDEATYSDDINEIHNTTKEGFTKNDSTTTQVQKIKEVALSFHEAYISSDNEGEGFTPFKPEVKKGENGKCKLDLSAYFAELEKLGTVSQRFFNSEMERTKSCAEFLLTLDWEEFQNADAYTYIDNCGFFYYSYWTRNQESYSGVEIDKIQKSEKGKKVRLVFYTDYDDERIYSRIFQPEVYLEKENDKWMIVKIEWLENNG